MTLRLPLIGLALTAAALAPAPQSDAPVTSATVQLVRTPVDVLFVSVQNMRDVPLVAWSVKVVFGPASGPTTTTSSNFLTSRVPATAWTSGTGPVAAGEVRRLRFSSQGAPEAAVTTVMLAAYADGVTEGAPADVAEFLATLRPLADDLAFWKQTFEEMPRTEPEGLAFLASRAADSKRARPDDPSHIAGDVLRWVVKPPPTWAFYDAVERLENETTARLAVATLPQMDADRRRTAAGETVDRPVSLAVHTDPALSANIMERIENLRDIPLEAWEIQIQDDPKGTMTSGHAVDFASVVEEVPPGQGPLKPHEVREEFLRADEVNAGTALPAARLRFASWSDLSYEGEKAARDEMYARREQRAKACEYWVAALTAAAGMSPADALASLRARQEEFPAKVPGRDDPMSGNLPMIARVVEQHPDTLAALLAGMRDRLERQRLILTRHLR